MPAPPFTMPTTTSRSTIAQLPTTPPLPSTDQNRSGPPPRRRFPPASAAGIRVGVPAGAGAGAKSGFATRSTENRFRLYRDLTEREGPIERARSDEEERSSISVPGIARRDEREDSAITTSNDAGVGDTAAESIVTPSEDIYDGAGERKDGTSIVTTVDDERIGDSVDSADSAVPLG